MSKEAMKLALEALKELVAQTETGLFAVRHDHVAMQDARQAITALREALTSVPDWASEAKEQSAQPTVPQDIPDLIAGTLGVSRGTAYDMMREALAQQEPVAYLVDGDLYYPEEIDWETLQEQGHTVAALYTSPPAQRTWVGLTDEDVRQCSRDVVAGGPENSVDRFAYAIEAKLKEKNNG